MEIIQNSWTAGELINLLSMFKDDIPIYLNVGYQHHPRIGIHQGRTIIGFSSDEFRLKTIKQFTDKLRTIPDNTIMFTYPDNSEYDDDTDWDMVIYNKGLTLLKQVNVIDTLGNYIIFGNL